MGGAAPPSDGDKHSFNDVIFALRKDPVTVYVCLALTLTGAMHGYDNGCSGDLNIMDGWRTAMGWSADQNTTSIFAWYNNAYYICAAIGAFFAGQISDILGRKKTCIYGGLIFALGGLIQSLAGLLGNNAFIPMFVGRGIVGVSVGTLSCVGPMYSSEVATPKIRGFMTSFYQINVSVFLLIGSIFGNFVRGTSNGWRYLLGLQFVMGLLLATLLSIVPESPKWLLSHSKFDETKTALRRLRSGDRGDDEYNELLLEYELEKQRLGTTNSSYTWKELFASSTIKYTMFIGVLVMFLQIFISAINVLVFYQNTIFSMLGMSEAQSFQSSIWTNLAFLIGVIFEVFVVDIAGRRSLFLIGMLFMGILLTAPGAIILAYDSDLSNEPVMGKLVVALIGLYMFSFGLTWGPLSWLYCSEIFNPQARGKGQSLTTSSNWGINFIQNLFVPALFRWSAGGPVIVFGVACLIIGIPLTFFLIPETRGVPLESMDLLFNTNAHGGFKKMVQNNIKKNIPEQARLGNAEVERSKNVDNTKKDFDEEVEMDA